MPGDVQVDGRTPQQALRLEALALDAAAGEAIERGVGHDIEIVAADFDVGDPGVWRKAVEHLPCAEAAAPVGFVDEERLATAGEQAARGVGAQRQEGFIR